MVGACLRRSRSASKASAHRKFRFRGCMAFLFVRTLGLRFALRDSCCSMLYPHVEGHPCSTAWGLDTRLRVCSAVYLACGGDCRSGHETRTGQRRNVACIADMKHAVWGKAER